MITVDANILLRLTNSSDTQYAQTGLALFKSMRTQKVVLFPQSLYEFWAVATRPKENNGIGMTTQRAMSWVNRYRTMFKILSDPPELLDRWYALVARHQVTGLRAYDTRYVAAMECHGITSLLTYNYKHFKDYGITVVYPASV